MSIEQALKRYSPGRLPGVYKDAPLYAERDALFKKAKSIVQSAHIPEMLGELADIIRSEFPDVKILDEVMDSSDGSISVMNLVWDSKPSGWKNSKEESSYKCIPVYVLMSKGGVVIGDELIVKEELANRELIEDAIAQTYKNPKKRSASAVAIG